MLFSAFFTFLKHVICVKIYFIFSSNVLERLRSTRRHFNLHTPTIDANFRRVRQTRAVDVVGKRSQAVVGVSRSDDKCVTRLVGEMTPFTASWPLGELACRRIDLLAMSARLQQLTSWPQMSDETGLEMVASRVNSSDVRWTNEHLVRMVDLTTSVAGEATSARWRSEWKWSRDAVTQTDSTPSSDSGSPVNNRARQ